MREPEECKTAIENSYNSIPTGNVSQSSNTAEVQDHISPVNPMSARIAELARLAQVAGVTIFHIAAEQGDAESIIFLTQTLAQQGREIDVNKKDNQERTPVFIAASKGYPLVINALHAAKANVDTPDEDGTTPVCIAADRGHALAIAALSIAKANMDTPDALNRTPMHLAVLSDRAKVITALHAVGVYVDNEMLFTAIQRPNECVKAVEALLEIGVSVNVFDTRGCTPLFYAAQRGYLNIVNMLLARRADPNQKTTEGVAPIWAAADKMHLDIVRALLAVGAHVRIERELDQETLERLKQSLWIKGKEVATLLEKHLKQSSQENKSESKPKDGIKKRPLSDLAFLTDEGLEIDKTDPLAVAISTKNISTINELIKKQDVNALNAEGLAPLHIAAAVGDKEGVEALISAGANVNISNKEGMTPLYAAVYAGNSNAVIALLGAKASLKAGGRPDASFSETVLQEAREKVTQNNTPISRAIVVLLETHLLSLAYADDVEAQLMIGYGYYEEKNNDKSQTNARTWFAEATKQGNSEAKYLLAAMMLEGKGGPQESAAGSRLLRESADEGHGDARYLLDRIAKNKRILDVQQEPNKTENIVEERIALLQQQRSQQAAKTLTKTPEEKQARKPVKPAPKREGSPKEDAQPSKTVSFTPKTLFSDALKERTADLNKMCCEIAKAKALTSQSAAAMQTSSQRLKQPLQNPTINKARLLKLDTNLRESKDLERRDARIKAEETLVNSFLDLLKGTEAKLTAEALQKSLTSVDDAAKSKPIFTVQEFSDLQRALVRGESIDDETFKKALDILEAKWVLLSTRVSSLIAELSAFNQYAQARRDEHLKLKLETGSVEFLSPDKVLSINQIFAQIGLVLKKLIITAPVLDEKKSEEEKLRLERVRNNRGTGGAGTQYPARRNSIVEGEAEKLSKAALRRRDEERQAAKIARGAARRAAHAQKKAQDLLKDQREAEVAAIDRIISGILPEGSVSPVFPVAVCKSEIKVAQEQEAQTIEEKPNLLYTSETMDAYNAAEELKLLIKTIAEIGTWKPDSIYAILQKFAYLNDILKQQHPHDAIKEVARDFRNKCFKLYKNVIDIVVSPRNLVDAANAWITFLETTEMRPEANEGEVLDKVSSSPLTYIHLQKWEALEETMIKKSCEAFEEMMYFGRAQRYGTGCGIRLMLGKIEQKFQNLITEGHEIIVTPEGETFRVYYKNKNNCRMTSLVLCNTTQSALINRLAKLKFNDKVIVTSLNAETEAIHEEIYAAVSSKEGCTHFGDDIIGRAAKDFYWAVTGAERGPLEQAIKVYENDCARRLLTRFAQFAPSVSREEHLKRGKEARHFSVPLQADIKQRLEDTKIDFEQLLFQRNPSPDPMTSNAGCSSEQYMHADSSLGKPPVTFAWLVYGEEANSQCSNESLVGHGNPKSNNGSPKNNGAPV